MVDRPTEVHGAMQVKALDYLKGIEDREEMVTAVIEKNRDLFSLVSVGPYPSPEGENAAFRSKLLGDATDEEFLRTPLDALRMILSVKLRQLEADMIENDS